jgi:uncharacterized protein (DUF1697 family)
MRYVALLRGIGPGNPSMRNEKLRGVLEGLGFDDVQSVISSGNVLFEAPRSPAAALEARIEAAWPEQLGFESTTIIRTARQVRDLIDADPFAGLDERPDARFQVTFLKHRLDGELGEPDDADIVTVRDRAVCWVVDPTGARTPQLMAWFERRLGTQITTRTWRTVERIAAELA